MELIERYLIEVRQHLPADIADDVARELRTLLEDSLEERAKKAGRAPDDALASELLRDFGDPETVAERYDRPRYLIGPRLLPVFESIAWGIALVPGAIALAGRLIRYALHGEPYFAPLSHIPLVIWNYVTATFTGIGFLVIVFAILERILPPAVLSEPVEEGAGEWDPRDLPPLPETESDRPVSMEEIGATFWMTIFWLVIVNAFPNLIGIPFGHERVYRWVPLTELGLVLPVVLLNIFWSGQLLFNVLLAHEGRRKMWLRWMEIGIGVFGIMVVGVMLTTFGPPALEPAWAEGGRKMARLVQIGLWVVLAIGVWQTLQRLRRLLLRPIDVR
jgi:hypothetical protein